MANDDANRPPDGLTVDGLWHVCVFLMKNLRGAMVDVSALRALLEERGAFSPDEFAQMQSRAEREADAYVTRLARAANDVALQKLLADFQGPTQ